MLNNKKILKIGFYLLTLGGILYYLVIADLLKWIIAGSSILYLIFYFGIATLAIFSVSISELGSLMKGLPPFLGLVLLVPMMLLLWFVLLLFWPLFIIPDSSLVRKPEKYDAIHRFENQVRTKYSKN